MTTINKLFEIYYYWYDVLYQISKYIKMGQLTENQQSLKLLGNIKGAIN